MSNGVMKPGKVKKRKRNKESIQLFLIALPFVLFIFAFSYVPLFGWAYAFTDYRAGKGLMDIEFVGLQHFIAIWNNRRELFRVLRNTFALSLLGLLFSPLPVVFAILINEIKSSKFRKLVQTFTTLPNFISWIVVFTLTFAMFSADGMVNGVLRKFGAESIMNPLGNNDLSLIHI